MTVEVTKQKNNLFNIFLNWYSDLFRIRNIFFSKLIICKLLEWIRFPGTWYRKPVWVTKTLFSNRNIKPVLLYCQICTHNTYRVKWNNTFVTPLRASRKFVHYDASCRYIGGIVYEKKNVSIEMNLWLVNWRRKRVGKVLANRINYQKVRY